MRLWWDVACSQWLPPPPKKRKRVLKCLYQSTLYFPPNRVSARRPLVFALPINLAVIVWGAEQWSWLIAYFVPYIMWVSASYRLTLKRQSKTRGGGVIAGELISWTLSQMATGSLLNLYSPLCSPNQWWFHRVGSSTPSITHAAITRPQKTWASPVENGKVTFLRFPTNAAQSLAAFCFVLLF